MSNDSEFITLDPAQLARLREQSVRFSEALFSGSAAPTDLDRYLPSPGDAMRTAAVRQMIPAALEACWRRGERVLIDTYLERYPELGGHQGVPAAIIYAEYRARHMHGDKPSLTDFESRFPQQWPELRRLVEDRPTHSPAPGNTPVASVQGAPTPPASVSSSSASAPPSPAFRPAGMSGTDIGGGYRLIRRIGSGSFGEVWRAEAPGGVGVAVKIIMRPLDHAEAKRELQSLELIKEMRHPFLLQTQAYWSLEDRLLIIMELAEGSLRDRLRECQRQGLKGLPHSELLRCFREAAEALDFLHARNVLHRDVKPDNLLLVGSHVKVADFGLARLQASRQLMTVTGSGTPAYMGPELWMGKVSQRSDLYSLAASYVELRLDRALFECDNMAALMLRHLNEEPDLHELPEPERKVLLKALAKEPEERYANCQEFMEEMTQAAAPPAPVVPPSAVPTRRFWPWLAAAALMLAAGAFAWQSYRPGAVSGRVVLGQSGTQQPQEAGKLQQPTAPPAEVDWLPAGATADAGAEKSAVPGSGKFYSRIAKTKAGQKFIFCLIPVPRGQSGLATFYILRDKVTNGQFQAAAGDPEFVANLAQLTMGHPALAPGKWRQGALADGKSLGISNPDLPVMAVSVTEAHCFADWLGGRLPSIEEWDKAAGFADGEQSPAQGAGKRVAVDRAKEGPMPVGTAADDVSKFKVRDLAGNGLEWTRNVDGSLTVPLPKASDSDQVFLRGRSYWDLRGPLRFRGQWEPGKCHYDRVRADIGFRVVLER